ncbi:MAG: DUF4288 domain-containing protein [Bacteroidia bacterium]
MNWYIAKLVFQIINNSETHQFEEQLRLIVANDYKEAMAKAGLIGLEGEDEFLNIDNHRVYWKFKGITNLHLLQNLNHGAELCSTIIEKHPADRYPETIKLKNSELTANLVATYN